MATLPMHASLNVFAIIHCAPPQSEIRVLEKVKGSWKIICVNVIAIEKDNEPKL